MTSTNKPKIIVIGGYGRSGSTLLEKILSNNDSIFATGELRHIWERSFLENQLCSCGNKFSECAFWEKTAANFIGRVTASVPQIIQQKSEVDRMRWIPSLVFPQLRSAKWLGKYKQYSQVILSLYEAIRETSGCNVILDSSKDPSYIYLLNAMAEDELIELYTLHLVRDSRAVAYSWQRNKKRPEIHWQEQNMPIYPSAKSAFEWLIMNFALGLVGLFARKRYYFLRYEDFVAAPQRELDKIANAAGISKIDMDKILPSERHTVSGNPIRFERGPIKIKPDTEWMEKMPVKDKILVSLLSLPLLAHYHYRMIR